MRIIAGCAKGRPILAPKGISTRPTLDRVKESLFSILQFSIPGARVLDLYAGSGNLGLEALSRGASFAVFNDRSRECAQLIHKNVETLGFQAQSQILQLDALDAIRRLQSGKAFQLAFLDPPYQEAAAPALQSLFEAELIADGGTAIVEHDWTSPPELPDSTFRLLHLSDRRRYRDTGISFYERNS